MKYLVKTLGCKANFADSLQMEEALALKGLTPARDGEEGVGLVIVNSCTVTDEADRQSRKTAERFAREYPGARIVFTGCGAEVSPEGLKSVQGLSYVVGNSNKTQMAHLLTEAMASPLPPPDSSVQILGGLTGYEELRSRHPIDREWALPVNSDVLATSTPSARTRAFYKIQEGCNAFCTYCIIPYGRGPSRSLRPREILSQIQKLVAEGVREVVITGTNIGDYGVDGAAPLDYPTQAFDDLLELLLKESGLSRLRLSSLDPAEISPRLLALMRQYPSLMPHFHVSLQSPHSKILRAMKRKYSAEEVEQTLHAIADLPVPGGQAFVGMDVITGFPGETQEIYQQTREALERLPWSRLHVFPYSEREGTPATRLPGSIEAGERKRRAKELQTLSLKRQEEHYRQSLQSIQRTGERLDGVLIESETRGPDGTRMWVAGYSPNYLRVLIRASNHQIETLQNTVVAVRPWQVVVDRQAQEVFFLADFLGGGERHDQ